VLARKAIEVCAESGQTAGMAPHEPPSAKARRPSVPPVALAGGAALLVIGIGAAALWRPKDVSPPPESTPAAASEVSASLTTAQIAAAAGPSTVSLSCESQMGSGFFIGTEQVLTNAHVVCPADPHVDVHFPDGRVMDGQVVNRDEALDLALVDVRGANATPLEVADASLLEPGEKVVLIGAPQGMDYTVHEGIVSHLGRNLYGVGYIQIDAAVNPGNSGGPLLDDRGQVVGVVTLKAEGADGIGFALPINYAHTGNAPVVRLSVPSSVSWDRMVAEVEAADLRDRDRAATAFARPGLLAAQSQFPGPNRIVFVVLMRSSIAPEGVRLELRLEKDGETMCEMKARVFQWQSLDELAAQATTEIPPDVRWLQGNGLGDDLWYAAARPSTYSGPCVYSNLQGWEAVLLDAEPGYERATIQ
jgi:hypothetical protein